MFSHCLPFKSPTTESSSDSIVLLAVVLTSSKMFALDQVSSMLSGHCLGRGRPRGLITTLDWLRVVTALVVAENLPWVAFLSMARLLF